MGGHLLRLPSSATEPRFRVVGTPLYRWCGMAINVELFLVTNSFSPTYVALA